MANQQQSSDEAQFLVIPRKTAPGSPGDALAELRQLAASSGVEVVRVVGPQQRPTRLIIRGARAAIGELRDRFAQQLLFEEDLPLSPI